MQLLPERSTQPCRHAIGLGFSLEHSLLFDCFSSCIKLGRQARNSLAAIRTFRQYFHSAALVHRHHFNLNTSITMIPALILLASIHPAFTPDDTGDVVNKEVRLVSAA